MQIQSNFGRSTSLFFVLILLALNSYSQSIDDNEIKKNVTTIHKPLERLIQLEPKVFEYDKEKFKDLKLPSGRQYGFMTENVRNMFPDLVGHKNYSYSIGKNSFRTARIQTLDAESIIPILVASIKEQQQMIDQLRQEITEIKSKTSTATIE